MQLTDRFDHQGFVCSENFTRSHVACELQSTAGKVRFIQLDSTFVRIGLAGDLAKNPITAFGVGQDQCRADLALGKILKRKRNQNYRTGCRCFHAALSGRSPGEWHAGEVVQTIDWARCYT